MPTPLNAITLGVGVMAHVFYADLIEEFAEALSNIPLPFVLMVSVVGEEEKLKATRVFSSIVNVTTLHVKIVPNRGRDLAPMLVAYREEILGLDVVCHIHTKKSLYTGNEQEEWRQYLVSSLLGDPARVQWILGMFQAAPRLGMVYPESFRAVPLTAHTWLSNKNHARELGARLGLVIDSEAYLDFSAGSMFWVRTDAIRPIFELGLVFNDFPIEEGQTDGTLHHALERVFAQVVRQKDMLIGILPTNNSLKLSTEGARNWKSYFELSVPDRITMGSIDASIVSFDIFDTLVVRPFLRPEGARAYLAWKVKENFNIDDFAALRERAESKARISAGKDVDADAIYTALASMPGGHALPTQQIQHLELDMEHRLLRPRQALVDVALHMRKVGKTVIGVSDMYLDGDTLAALLPIEVRNAVEKNYVSCDTGWRKDTGQTWERLPEKLTQSRAEWLHVGDNEHSDIQLPYDWGFIPPVHVLRPSALLEVVPALRSLRPSATQASHWPNQMLLGLVVNRLAALADLDPSSFDDTVSIDDAETLGYVALGPLVLDYLTWAGRLAVSEKVDQVLFLSREGFLLQQEYEFLRQTAGGVVPKGTYLLASRRGTGTASITGFQDLIHLLGSTYTGSLHGLLNSRMGNGIADLARHTLGEAAVNGEVFLPEMRQAILEMLTPISCEILAVANRERDSYLHYWDSQVGQSKVMLSDIGYGGTIQGHLSRIAGRALGGAYFALNAQAGANWQAGNWAKARYCDQRVSDERSPILDNDLLLERLLTSPDGQFSHFEEQEHQLHPRYVPGTQLEFGTVSRIHQGVHAFIKDAFSVVGSDIFKLEFASALVQQPLKCLGEGLWVSRALTQLTLDDYFTGRGEVSVLKMKRSAT